MGIGVITKLVSEKGIGFISPSGGKNDVFFHFSVLVGEQFEQLKEGQAVTFDLDTEESTRDRPRAAKVEPCDPKLLGKSGENEKAAAHPRARRRKPTWRR